jgi:hypothetical protein
LSDFPTYQDLASGLRSCASRAGQIRQECRNWLAVTSPGKHNSGFSAYFQYITTSLIYPEVGIRTAIFFSVNFRDRKHSVWTALILGLLLAGSVSNSHAQSQDAVLGTERPILEMDLRSYGYKSHLRGTRDHWSIAFVDKDDLVLGWTTFDDSDVGKKTGYLAAAPSHLHVVVLNARTGQKRIVRDWAVSTFFANIYPVAKGEFLICTGNAILLFSQNFDLVRELTLSRFGPCTANEVSPSGRSFSIDSGSGKQLQRSVMKTESFAPVTTWSNDARNVHFSDTSLVGSCVPNGELCAREFDTSWAPFPFSGADRQTRVRRFVDDSTLVLTTGSGLAVVTTDGNPLFHVNLESKQSIGETAFSSGGQRFAVVQMRMRGVTNEFLDISAFPSDDQVVVYGLLERKAIYARKVKGTSPWPPFIGHRNRLAISSDGTLLAIFDDGILSVYQLPVPKS